MVDPVALKPRPKCIQLRSTIISICLGLYIPLLLLQEGSYKLMKTLHNYIYAAGLLLSQYKKVTKSNGKYTTEDIKAKLQFEKDFYKYSRSPFLNLN